MGAEMEIQDSFIGVKARRKIAKIMAIISNSQLMNPFIILARRSDQDDELFVWQSRMFVRNYYLGKEVHYNIERTIPSTQKIFGIVYVGNRNLSAVMIVNSLAWVKIQTQRQGGNPKNHKAVKIVQKNPNELEITNLDDIQNEVKQSGFGIWNKKREEQEKAKHCLPPSPFDGHGDFDCQALLNAINGKKIRAFMEYVRDGSALRLYLLPHFYLVQVFVQGVKSPSMGRRETNGKDGVAPQPFARKAKHFVELRLLNRDILVTIDGCDVFGNFSGTVLYKEGDEEKNLAIKLLQNGFARYLDSSGRRMIKECQTQLKEVELTTKANHIGMWKDYVAQYVLLLSSFKEQLQQHVTVHAMEAVMACWELEQSLHTLTALCGVVMYNYLKVKKGTSHSFFDVAQVKSNY